jgi:hypothetical protein
VFEGFTALGSQRCSSNSKMGWAAWTGLGGLFKPGWASSLFWSVWLAVTFFI